MRHMTDGEIITSYRQAKNKREQVGILADLCACDPVVMEEKLMELGQIAPENVTLDYVRCDQLYSEGKTDLQISEMLGEPISKIVKWRKAKGFRANYPTKESRKTPVKKPKPQAKKTAPKSTKLNIGDVRPTLVPASLILSVAAVREHDSCKRKGPDGWKKETSSYYRESLYRHWLAYLGGEAVDQESGLPHLWHVATDAAYIIDLEETYGKTKKNSPAHQGDAPDALSPEADGRSVQDQ